MTDLQKAMAEVNDLNRSHGVTQRGGKNTQKFSFVSKHFAKRLVQITELTHKFLLMMASALSLKQSSQTPLA